MLMIVYLFHALLITVVLELIFIHFNKLPKYLHIPPLLDKTYYVLPPRIITLR